MWLWPSGTLSAAPHRSRSFFSIPARTRESHVKGQRCLRVRTTSELFSHGNKTNNVVTARAISSFWQRWREREEESPTGKGSQVLAGIRHPQRRQTPRHSSQPVLQCHSGPPTGYISRLIFDPIHPVRREMRVVGTCWAGIRNFGRKRESVVAGPSAELPSVQPTRPHRCSSRTWPCVRICACAIRCQLILPVNLILKETLLGWCESFSWPFLCSTLENSEFPNLVLTEKYGQPALFTWLYLLNLESYQKLVNCKVKALEILYNFAVDHSPPSPTPQKI